MCICVYIYACVYVRACVRVFVCVDDAFEYIYRVENIVKIYLVGWNGDRIVENEARVVDRCGGRV